MLRTLLMTGVSVMLGIFALGSVFRIFGGLTALTFVPLGVAAKALIVGGVAYLVIRVVSPNTARRLRDRWSGTRVDRY